MQVIKFGNIHLNLVIYNEIIYDIYTNLSKQYSFLCSKWFTKSLNFNYAKFNLTPEKSVLFGFCLNIITRNKMVLFILNNNCYVIIIKSTYCFSFKPSLY